MPIGTFSTPVSEAAADGADGDAQPGLCWRQLDDLSEAPKTLSPSMGVPAHVLLAAHQG